MESSYNAKDRPRDQRIPRTEKVSFDAFKSQGQYLSGEATTNPTLKDRVTFSAEPPPLGQHFHNPHIHSFTLATEPSLDRGPPPELPPPRPTASLQSQTHKMVTSTLEAYMALDGKFNALDNLKSSTTATEEYHIMRGRFLRVGQFELKRLTQQLRKDQE